MAAADALDGQPSSLQEPIPADGFVAIMGATRFKTTGGRKKRRDEPLIEAYKCQS
jgi:hypothetical protein